MYYVEHLLMNWEEIKNTGDIDSEEFNDLLILEVKLKQFRQSGKISEEDMDLIHLYQGKPVIKNRANASNNFKDVARRLALSLGGKFTDDGYLNYMQRRYHLDQVSVEKLRKVITSSWKHRIMERKVAQTD